MALTLRTLGGLTTEQIARAFLEPEATTAQRLVRAKRKIREAGISYQVPAREDLPERLDAVLEVLYLVFNEGYVSAGGELLLRVELCEEALRLAGLLGSLMPGEPEVLGLRALMTLHHARRDTRTGADGVPVPLEDQDRSRWRAGEIAHGVALLDEALALRRGGPYQVQAAIAALHAQAPSPKDTDWPQIVLLYEALLRLKPSPAAALAHAGAVAMASGPEAGLTRIAALAEDPALSDYHWLPAARADLLRRAGRRAEAAQAYRVAIARTANAPERRFLERRLAEVS